MSTLGSFSQQLQWTWSSYKKASLVDVVMSRTTAIFETHI